MKIPTLASAMLVLTLMFASSAFANAGSLVIVGGGLSRDNAAIYRAFIDRAAAGRIVIIPAASAAPAESATAFMDAMESYGVSSDRVDIASIAVIDDPSTREVDESTWARGAYATSEVAKIEAASAIWMTGGDQARLIQTLTASDGGDTPALAAMRERLAAGAVVGGTSAGAAVMSRRMIAHGDALTALLAPLSAPGEDTREDGGEPLALARGFGLLSVSLVDQHFGERARLGRLVRALAEQEIEQRVGFGIDENTAMVVDLSARVVTLAGVGALTVLDARRARFATRRGRFSADGLSLHVLTAGDSIALDGALTITPAAAKRRIESGAEAYDHVVSNSVGMAIPSNTLESILGADLLDNSASQAVERASFRADGAGVIYRFAEHADSRAFFGRDETGRGRYTLSGVAFSVRPIQVHVRALN